MPAIQPRAWKIGALDLVLDPARNSGKANIRANVPALPNHVTSMRLAPMAARPMVAAETKTSRAMTIQQNHTGAPGGSTSRMPAMPTKNSSRSATGSSTLPSVDTWWKWRAM